MKKILIFLCLILSICLVGCNNKNEEPIIPDYPIIPDNPDDPTEPEKEDNTVHYRHTKLLCFDKEKNHIEFLNVKSNKITKDTLVNKLDKNKNKTKGSFDDLYVGMENIYVKYKGMEVLEILIDGEPIFNNIRVAIRNSIDNISDESTLFHKTLTIRTPITTFIKSYDGKNMYQVSGKTNLSFSVKDNNIICYNDKVLIKSDKRLIIKGTSLGLQVTSISRAIGIPTYEGDLELAVVDGKLLLINDVKMEDYLKKVVPSEMPSSWNINALKAQAVAARTYAYCEFFSPSSIERGYVVDDSTSSQVYNNGFEQDSTNIAVEETKGLTMFNNNRPIVAYYYSAGCGLKAAGNEVWITDKVTSDIPYLHGGNVSNRKVDTKDESDMLKFFKDLNVSAPSVNSTRFRWHLPMTFDQLRNTLNTNLPLMIPGKEKSYKVLDNGKWVSKEIPSDIGEIKNIRVSERGSSGVVISLEVEATNVTFRIYNQFNIRFTVRPKDCGSDVLGFASKGNRYTYLNTFNNPSILPSGFFALEIVGNTVNFYGGGNGHGVGMDQYGAQFLGSQDKNFKDILETYYSNIDFLDTSVEYKPILEFEKYFS